MNNSKTDLTLMHNNIKRIIFGENILKQCIQVSVFLYKQCTDRSLNHIFKLTMII